ncbi:MAG: GNAT family N-acetyltransferase [Clostridia bacterium]|nr:GNAT family N-acetyltransferase [Clostridia bacterium]
MKPLSLSEYLKSPCSSASIPYWKQKNLILPKNIKIVHDNDYVKNEFIDYIDEPYFRLYHDLKLIKHTDLNNIEIVTATVGLLDNFVEIINASYTDLSVTKEQIEGFTKTPVYRPDLWVLLRDKASGSFVGCGIADYDKNIGEMTLEWIQVIPSFRGKSYGSYIVNHLLSKMQGIAKFATVSGKVNNPTRPENLYRKCGFTGEDIWHILYEK